MGNKTEQSLGINSLDIGSEYTEEEMEFLHAVRHYMKVHNKRFPAFTEILRVAKSLGYRKVDGPVEPITSADSAQL